MGDRPGRPQGAASFWVLGLAVAGLCLSLWRVVVFVPFACAGPEAGPNGFELTFHVAGLVVLNVSPVWVSCGWSVRPLPALCCVVLRWRPYRVECTGSLPTSEVKRRKARLVLGWGTAWEDLRVLSAFAEFAVHTDRTRLPRAHTTSYVVGQRPIRTQSHTLHPAEVTARHSAPLSHHCK